MDKYASSKQEKAINLRNQGLSYREINLKLNIPKSTLSNWLSVLPLSQVIKNKNIEKAKAESSKNITEFNRKRSVIYHKKTSKEIKMYSSQISKLTKKDIFNLGIGLFLAEGSRKEKWMVRFVNSDPLIIKIAMKFFSDICHVDTKDIKLRIALHPNCNNYESVSFWSKITEVPKDQFYRPQTIISKNSKQKRVKNQLPYGTLHVTIINAKLMRMLKGWVLGISSQV